MDFTTYWAFETSLKVSLNLFQELPISDPSMKKKHK